MYGAAGEWHGEIKAVERRAYAIAGVIIIIALLGAQHLDMALYGWICIPLVQQKRLTVQV